MNNLPNIIWCKHDLQNVGIYFYLEAQYWFTFIPDAYKTSNSFYTLKGILSFKGLEKIESFNYHKILEEYRIFDSRSVANSYKVINSIDKCRVFGLAQGIYTLRKNLTIEQSNYLIDYLDKTTPFTLKRRHVK